MDTNDNVITSYAALNWAYEFYSAELNRLPDAIRECINWDLVAAKMTEDLRRPLDTLGSSEGGDLTAHYRDKTPSQIQPQEEETPRITVQVKSSSAYYPFEVREALGEVLLHFHDAEEADFDAVGPDEQGRHIFPSLKLLGEWLTYINRQICF